MDRYKISYDIHVSQMMNLSGDGDLLTLCSGATMRLRCAVMSKISQTTMREISTEFGRNACSSQDSFSIC